MVTLDSLAETQDIEDIKDIKKQIQSERIFQRVDDLSSQRRSEVTQHWVKMVSEA